MTIVPIGRVHSRLTHRGEAPRQSYEGAPEATLEIDPAYVRALDGLRAGDAIIVLTWLHQSQRDVLVVHPRGEITNPLTGVFATRSPDRPNPIGLHRVRLVAVEAERWLHVDALEALDGTPIVDIKPVLDESRDA